VSWPVIQVADICSLEAHVYHEGQAALWVDAQDKCLVGLPQDDLVFMGVLKEELLH